MPCWVIRFLTAALLPRHTEKLYAKTNSILENFAVIHFHEVQKSVGKKQILSDLSLFLPKASYTLINGSEGSGKQLLVRMIMAYEMPDHGSLQVNGIDIGSISRQRIPWLRRQIGLIAENPALLEQQTVAENISVPLQLAGFDRDVITQRLHAMLELTGLSDEQNKKVIDLQASQRQLVSAARATIHKPLIVLAEEPRLEPRPEPRLAPQEPQQTDTEIANKIVSMLNTANESGATIVATKRTNSGFFDSISHIAQAVTLEDGTIKYDELEQDTID